MAIIPDLSTNNVSKFTKEQVALVYGSICKQRYFTKVGDVYYPLPVQWDIRSKKWLKYHIADMGADSGALMHSAVALCEPSKAGN